MGLRSWIKRLERDAQEEMIVIPQADGTLKRFPQSAAKEAFMNAMARMGAGSEADAPPEHPLTAAARNSSDPTWAQSFYAAGEPDEWIAPVEDLSEA
jgi:hypothetical protein